MGYNLLMNVVYCGYNPLTNHLLTSWDIQVIQRPGMFKCMFIRLLRDSLFITYYWCWCYYHLYYFYCYWNTTTIILLLLLPLLLLLLLLLLLPLRFNCCCLLIMTITLDSFKTSHSKGYWGQRVEWHCLPKRWNAQNFGTTSFTPKLAILVQRWHVERVLRFPQKII